MVKEIFVHVGAHKTGTSLLQNSLYLSKGDLELNGISYIHKREINSLKFYRYSRALFNKKDQEPIGFDESQKEFSDLIGGLSNHKVVFSHEGLLGGTTIDVGGRYENLEGYESGRMYGLSGIASDFFRELCLGHRLKIVLYIRRHSDFLESIYLQRVAAGHDISFDDFLGSIDTSSISWKHTICDIARSVGTENVIIRVFELIRYGDQSFVEDFLKQVAPEVQVDVTISSEQNRGLSGVGLGQLRSAYPGMRLEDRKRLGRKMRRDFSNRDYDRPVLFTADHAKRLNRQYQQEYAWILDNYVTDCPGPVRDFYLQ